MSEDQKPVAPAETTARPENASQPEQPVAVATPITPPSSKLIPTTKRTLILMFLVLIIGIGIILWAWKIGPFDSAVESTDNSYIKGKTTVLSSQINGYVKDVLVSDFDHVKKGQVLMHIDATTYDQKVTQAEAGVDQAQNAQANLLVAKEALKTAQVAETGLKAQVTNASAQLDQAKTTKNYSSIIAPMDGQLGEVNPRVGQYVAAGTQLLYLIPQQTWVTANFKETQIANMKIGQKAWFTVDALNHQKFKGHVEQISPAAGSEFSVLKADNATGNFTKVVQRIAVRIAIDPNQTGIKNLRPGMSVISSVDTHSAQR